MEKDSQRKQRGVMFGGWISSVSVFKRGCIGDQEVLYLSSEIGEPKLQYHYLAASSPLERNLVHFLSTYVLLTSKKYMGRYIEGRGSKEIYALAFVQKARIQLDAKKHSICSRKG